MLPIRSETRLGKLAVAALLLVGMLGTVSATALDGFEDGDSDGWVEGDNIIHSVTTSDASSGSYSLELEEVGDGGDFSFTNSSSSFQPSSLSFDVKSVQDVNSGGAFSVIFRDGSDSLTQVRFNSGDIHLVDSSSEFDTGVDYSTGNRKNVEFSGIDWSNNQVSEISYGGQTLATDMSFQNSATSVYENIYIYYDNNAGSGVFRLDDVSVPVSDSYFNSPPSIDSVSTDPMSWSVGSSINVSANVSDSDGSVQSVSADVWENGTQIVSGASLTNNSGTWEVDDLFTVDESDVYYNYTLTATDDDGATATYSDSQLIKDKPPKFSIKDLENKTYFRYENNWTVQVEKDGDNVPQESISCNVFLDGNQSASFSGVEPFSESGTASTDLGGHSFKVSCSDQGGNTKNKSVNYTVKAFKLQSTSGSSEVYETEDTDFQIQGKYGEMVNSVDINLLWNGSTADNSVLSGLSGISSFSESLTKQDVPLVASNNTGINWQFHYTVNRTDFQSSTYTENTETSALKTQDIYHGFYVNSQSLDKSKYLERDEADYNATLVNKTGKASITGDVTTNVTQMLVGLSLRNVSGDESVYGSSVQLPSVDSEKERFFFDSNFTVEFNGDERSIDPVNVERDLYQFGLTDCSGGNPVALDFETYYEFDQSKKATTQLDWAASIWNKGSPDFKRTVNFSSQGKSSHEYCVNPSWARLRIDNRDKLLQYFNDSADLVRRSYFLMNESVDNSTTTIPLYTNYRNRTNRVSITIEDGEGNGVPDTIVTFERYFPAKDKYITTAMTRTGSQGDSETFLEVNEIYYQFKFFQDGELIEEKPPQTVPDSLELFFELGEDVSSGYYDVEGRVEYDCNVENTSTFSCGYSGPESMENITLKVDKREQIGYSTNCSVSSTSSNGRLICTGLNTTSDKYKYSLTAYYPTQSVSVTTGYIGQLSNSWAQAGLFIYFMLFITTSFAGLWRPEASIALGMLSTLVAYVVGFLVVTQTAVISMLAVGVALIWRMS